MRSPPPPNQSQLPRPLQAALAVAAPTSDELIRRTASETARQTALAVSEVMRPRDEKPVVVAPAFEMTAQDEKDYKIIQFLESTGKPKFKGMGAKFLAYVKSHYAYQEQWLATNAGKEYDMNAEEHNAWYEANQPEITPEELSDGEIDMKVTERTDAVYREKIKPREDAQNAKQAFEDNLPTLAKNVTRHVVGFTREVNPALAILITDENGEPVMSKENIDKLMETDPIAGEVMDEIVRNELEPLLLELEKTTITDSEGNPVFVLNPTRSRHHAVIDQFRQHTERDILAGTNQVVDGKQFVTLQKLQDLQNKAIASGTDEEKEQRLAEITNQYWTINIDHVESSIVKSYAEKAKKLIEKQDKMAKKKYGVADTEPVPRQTAAGTPAAVPAVGRPQIPAAPAARTNGKPNAPSVSTQSEVVTTRKPVAPEEKKFAEDATSVMFGR